MKTSSFRSTTLRPLCLIKFRKKYRLIKRKAGASKAKRGDCNERQGGRTQCPLRSLYRYFFMFTTWPRSRPCYATFVTVYRVYRVTGSAEEIYLASRGELPSRTYDPPFMCVCTCQDTAQSSFKPR